jgi:hypothetical protein
METTEAPPRGVSILGHPVAGLLPVTFLGAGWLLLALQVVPWMRDRSAAVAMRGMVPGLHDVWPPSPQILLLSMVAFGLLLIGVVLMIVWARSAGGFGPLSDRLLSRVEALAGIMFLACAVLTAGLLAPGIPSLTDTKTHVARGILWFDSLRAGQFPLWTDIWSCGFPADQHYPPLSHIFQALLMLLRLDPYEAIKVLMWFARISGGIGFALFAAHAHKDKRSGFLGGLIYALSPVFHSLWVWDGWASGAVMLGILPWAFLAADRLATGSGRIRAGAAFALALGAMVMSHTLPTRIAVIVILAYVLLRAVPTAATRGARAPSVGGLLLGWIGGLILAACFLLPILRESSWVNQMVAPGLGISPHLPVPGAILDTIRWNRMGKEYVGITVAILALAGVAIAIRDRKSGQRAIGAIPLAVMILLPWCLASPGPRMLIPVAIGTMLAAAGSVRRDPTRLRFGHRVLFPLAILLVIVDLAPFSLMTSYGEHVAWRRTVYSNLAGRMEGGRLLELPTDEAGKPVPDFWRYPDVAEIPSVGCPYSQGAPRAYAHVVAAIDTVANALATGKPLDPDLVRLLAVHDVSRLLVTERRGPVSLAGVATEGFVFDPEIPAYLIESASAVSVLEPGRPEGPQVPGSLVFDDTGLPPTASRALAAGALAWVRAAKPRPVPEARSVVLPNRLQIDVPDVGPATLRIARNTYPSTRVMVDGREWPWRDAPLGGIAIDVARGPHKIEVWGAEDRVRRVCRYVQWGLVGLLFLVSIGPRRR